MKKTLLTAALAAVIGVSAYGLADAQQGRRGPGGPGGPGFGPGHGRGMMGVHMQDLTDQQRQQIRSIMQERRDDRQGQQPGELHRQLRAELLADSPDEAKIQALRQQMLEHHGAMLSQDIEVQKKVAQILTPEQRAKAREALSNARGPRARR